MSDCTSPQLHPGYILRSLLASWLVSNSTTLLLPSAKFSHLASHQHEGLAVISLPPTTPPPLRLHMGVSVSGVISSVSPSALGYRGNSDLNYGAQ